MINRLYEIEQDSDVPDPDHVPAKDRKLFTQPYDINVRSMIEQIKDKTLHLRPLTERPRFQRKYVWPNRLASLLIESILLNIPIPPCYFSQNEDFELDVIDGQQRIFSIFRFLDNQFPLTDLEVLSELNGKRFHKLDRRTQLQIETHTLRAVIITNDSHPEIQFDVFERLNANTMPLNAQELRNCMYRGALNNLLGELSVYKPWLEILGRNNPDKRLRDEELILRFFAFRLQGLATYKTPQKYWLNDVAKKGKSFSDGKIQSLDISWRTAIDNCRLVFSPDNCFRRNDGDGKRRVVNRALMDLVMTTMDGKSEEVVSSRASAFRKQYELLLNDEEFLDLIGRAVDHKSRTERRFKMWHERLEKIVF